MPDKSFAIQLHHRPRRVAFLVDLSDHVEEILDAILRFNLASWGGRHNPIVPLIEKRLPASYYPLLDVADPDVFYIYGQIADAELEEIHYRYRPTYVGVHVTRPPIDSHSYFVQLDNQATVDNILRNIREQTPQIFGRPEPCILQLNDPDGRDLSAFFRWNFGYTGRNFFAIQNDGVLGCKPRSTSDADLLETLATQLGLLWSVHICGNAPLARTTNDSTRNFVPVFWGESVYNRLAFWNDGLASGPTPPFRAGINQLWLTPAVVADEVAYRHLINLIQKRVYRVGNYDRRLRMVSYDVDERELEAVGKKIANDSRWAITYGEAVKLTPPGIGTIEPQRVYSFFSRQLEIQYASGADVHLSLPKPPEIREGSDERWVVGLRIDNPSQELPYLNAAPWWLLPRKSSLSGLFDRRRPKRIDGSHSIAFEVNAREATLDFGIPSDGRLLRELLAAQIPIFLAADARSSLKAPSLYEIQLSDKGTYFSGIRGLFNALRDALYLFEHPFWRSLISTLSEKRPSEQLMSKLTSDIHRFLNRSTSSDNVTQEAWLADKVMLAAKQLSKTATWLTFTGIEQLYSKYLEQLSAEDRADADRDLRADLSGLTQDGVLLQGVALRCPKCLSQYWYSIEEMHKSIVCRGCHYTFPLPAETEWSYQLNELVRAGIAEQGLLPVFRTLARLYCDANHSFFFIPSVAFLVYEDQDDKPRLDHEVDLAWIKDGVFGVAEIKNRTDLFKTSDFEDLVKMAHEMRPDVILIAAHEGEDDDLRRKKQNRRTTSDQGGGRRLGAV